MLHVPDSGATYAGGTIRDPFGHRWFVQTALEPDDVPVEDVFGRRYGDVGYMTLLVADGERAGRFFGSLFDWQLEAGYQPGAFHVSSITPPAGIDSRPGSPEVRLYFRVDDQGLRFDLFRPKPGY